LHFSDVHIDRQYTVTSHLFNLLYMCVWKYINWPLLSLVQKQTARNRYVAGLLQTIRVALPLCQQVQMANTNAILQFPWLTLCWNLHNKLEIMPNSQSLRVMSSKVSPVQDRLTYAETYGEAFVWLVNKRWISNTMPSCPVPLTRYLVE
jgi:hypothetical protein